MNHLPEPLRNLYWFPKLGCLEVYSFWKVNWANHDQMVTIETEDAAVMFRLCDLQLLHMELGPMPAYMHALDSLWFYCAHGLRPVKFRRK